MSQALQTPPASATPVSPAPVVKRGWRMPNAARLIWPTLALALLMAYNARTNPGFFHIEQRDGHLYGSLIDVLNRGAPVMLLSLGMTLVIATGGIDLSVGAVMAIAGAVAANLIARPAGSPLNWLDVHGAIPAVVLIALAASLLAGLWNGLLVVALDLQPIVATLILMVAGRGIAQLIANGAITTFTNPHFAFLARGYFLWLPFPITIVVLATLMIGLITRGTALGLFVESVGNNPAASRLAGLPGKWVKLLVYVVSGLCAGIAGLIVTADIQGADANNAGLFLELDAILAVSVGGTALTGGRFSFIGSLIGVVLIQSLTITIVMKNIDDAWAYVIKGAVVIAACMLQSPRFRGHLRRGFGRLWKRKRTI